MKDRFVAIYCPPVKDFIEQPKDISAATKESCPECGQSMWLSEKKKLLYAAAKRAKKTILFCCYDCFLKIAKEKVKSGEWNIGDINIINI